jgi:hypothetical protein
LRKFSFFNQSCFFLFGHLLIAAALGPKPVPLIYLQVARQHQMRRCAIQTTRMDVVHGGHMYFRTHQAPHLHAGLDTRTMRPLRNPVPLLKRLPAAFATHASSELSSHEPGKWGHRDKSAQLNSQRPVEAL